MNNNPTDFFQNALQQLNIQLNSGSITQILLYFEKLLDKNTNINLISRQSAYFDSIIIHLVDSLTPLKTGFPQFLELLDLGSGGGLPGIPLALANPGWNVTLVESKAKKCAFLTEMSTLFDQKRIKILNQFLEPNGRSLQDKRGFFDLVTVRAVDKLPSLISTVSHLIKQDGSLIAYKGPNYEDELRLASKELLKNNLVLYLKLDCILPVVNAKRTLLFFRKQASQD
jgi:16S rRNA (guanine527-N7)-methyltransferase